MPTALPTAELAARALEVRAQDLQVGDVVVGVLNGEPLRFHGRHEVTEVEVQPTQVVIETRIPGATTPVRIVRSLDRVFLVERAPEPTGTCDSCGREFPEEFLTSFNAGIDDVLTGCPECLRIQDPNLTLNEVTAMVPGVLVLPGEFVMSYITAPGVTVVTGVGIVRKGQELRAVTSWSFGHLNNPRIRPHSTLCLASTIAFRSR